MSCTWNEWILNLAMSINWRASLVPAAAVIPAPIAYIKAVAVKEARSRTFVGQSAFPQSRLLSWNLQMKHYNHAFHSGHVQLKTMETYVRKQDIILGHLHSQIFGNHGTLIKFKSRYKISKRQQYVCMW